MAMYIASKKWKWERHVGVSLRRISFPHISRFSQTSNAYAMSMVSSQPRAVPLPLVSLQQLIIGKQKHTTCEPPT